MYEHPETHFEELALRFMDIRKRIYKFPKMGVKRNWSLLQPHQVPVQKSPRLLWLLMTQQARNIHWQTMH